MKSFKISIPIVFLFLSGFIYAQNPIDRVLPVDTYFYNPIINTTNQMSFPNGNSSTTALQSMINNLSTSGGGVLTINAGTYTLEQIHMKTGVHIRVHPDVVFKSIPRNALFRAGYDSSFANVNNWSFQSTNGQRFTFDFSNLQPNEDIRAFQLGNANNFRIADFVILDNYTKFNGISSGAVGNETTQGSALFPSFGIIENLDIEKAHYGYGLIQSQVAQNILFRNLSGEGGVTLRFESGFSGLADRYLTDQSPIINNNYGRNISCRNGAHAVMLSPHTITQGIVDIRDVSGVSCEAVTSINFGFLSESKGQADANGNPINGHSSGTFSEESVIANVSATYGVNAQVRAARLRYVPCALRSYIHLDEKNLDEESYKSPSLAPVYYLALEDYVSLDSPDGRYKIVLDNVTHTGFSAEIRADGLITDGGENDFEGCDIDDSPFFIKAEDRNTPNPLQTSTMAEVLNVNNFINEKDILVYQKDNLDFLIIKSDFNATIKIYNLLGQLLLKEIKNTKEINIDVSNLSKNFYIMHFEAGTKKGIKKFLIK